MAGTTRTSVPRRRVVARALTAVAAFALCGVGLAGSPAQGVPTANSVTARIMSGWMPYWTNSTSLASVSANADLFSDVSPFWHDSRNDGSGVRITDNLNGATRASTLASLRAKAPGVSVLPSITDGTSARHMASVLKDPGRRTTLVNQIVALVVGNGYDGIDLDFERFAFYDGYSTWATTRPAWVAFIAQLADKLHARGKLLAVAVPPMYNSKYNSSSGYWVYDFPRIAANVDRLRVMAYDYSWDVPGPIAPLPWTKTVAAYAASVVPGSKVQLGVPTYGRDWVRRNSDGSKKITGTCPTNKTVPTGTVVYTANQTASVPGKLGLPASAMARDAASGELVVTYSLAYSGTAGGVSVTCRVYRQAWLADAQSVVDRANVAVGYGLRGIATWTIGGEASGQWARLRAISGSVPPAGSASGRSQQVAASGPRTARAGRRTAVRGQVEPGRKRVKVVRQMKVRGHWRAMGATRTKTGGAFRFSLKLPRPRAKYVYRFVAKRGGGYKRAVSGRVVIRTV